MRRLAPLVLLLIPGVLAGQPPTTPNRDPAVALAKKIADDVSEFRGLPWKREVDIASYDMGELKAFVMKALDKEMPDARAARATRALKLLGLLPNDYELKKGFKEILVEQIGGFYDPEAKQLRIIDRGTVEGDAVAKMVERMGLSAQDMDRTVMAHELVHALQDQHFDLERLPLDRDDDDDLVVAVSSLVEGDATLSMMGMMMPGVDAGTLFGRAKQLALTVKLMGGLSGLAPGDMKAYKNAPEMLKERMMFPYLGGLLFCLQAGQGDKAFKGVDAVFSLPPLSTEQVLHPEKRLGDEPDWPQILEPQFQDGAARPIYQNTLGELFTRVMLETGISKRAARTAAAGWDGDRYMLFEGEDGADAVIWLSTWDTEDDAKEAFTALQLWVGHRNGQKDDVSAAGIISRQGIDVSLCIGIDMAQAKELGPAMLRDMKRRERTTLPKRAAK